MQEPVSMQQRLYCLRPLLCSWYRWQQPIAALAIICSILIRWHRFCLRWLFRFCCFTSVNRPVSMHIWSRHAIWYFLWLSVFPYLHPMSESSIIQYRHWMIIKISIRNIRAALQQPRMSCARCMGITCPMRERWILCRIRQTSWYRSPTVLSHLFRKNPVRFRTSSLPPR